MDLEFSSGSPGMNLLTSEGFASALYHCCRLEPGSGATLAPVCSSFVFMPGPQSLGIIQMYPMIFGIIQMHPMIFGIIQMYPMIFGDHPNVSNDIWDHPNVSNDIWGSSKCSQNVSQRFMRMNHHSKTIVVIPFPFPHHSYS